jgi:hypothetical protein
MKKPHNSTLRIITICSACLIVSACASDRYKEFNTATSEPVAVNPAMDNKIVLDNLETGLVATLVIDGDQISVTKLQIRMIPRMAKPRSQGELITIKGLSNGNTVTEIQTPDNRINVQEGKGIVILDKRTISFTLPMPQFIDALEVTIPSTGKTKRISTSDQLYKQCQKHKNLRECNREKPQPMIK